MKLDDNVLIKWVENPELEEIPWVIKHGLEGLAPRMDATRRTALRRNQQIRELVAILPEEHFIHKVLADQGIRPRRGGPKVPTTEEIAELTTPRDRYSVGGSSGSGLNSGAAGSAANVLTVVAMAATLGTGATMQVPSNEDYIPEDNVIVCWYKYMSYIAQFVDLRSTN